MSATQTSDTVYDLQGVEYTLICELPGKSGYAVREIFEDENGCPMEGDIIFRDCVYEAPPKQKLQSDIQKYQDQLDAVRSQVREATKELRCITEERAKRIDKLSKQNTALARIEQFLDGEITHYVFSYYGEVKILPLSDAVCDSKDWRTRKKPLKLLTLFGTEAGNLEWHLNRYEDGSGADHECYPCTSTEEANAKASELINIAINDYRNEKRNSHRLEETFKAAKKYNLSFPTDLVVEIHKLKMQCHDAIIKKRQEEMDDAIAERDKCQSEQESK